MRGLAQLLLGALFMAVIPAAAAARPMTPSDMVSLGRVGDVQLSPDGRQIVFSYSQPNLQSGRSTSGVWIVAADGSQPPRRLPLSDGGASDVRWSADGKSLYFLSRRSGLTQLWKGELASGATKQLTQLPLDIGSYKISPSGRKLLVALDIFVDCKTLACTVERQAAQTTQAGSGVTYTRLPIRNIFQWTGKTRSHLYALNLGTDGVASGTPVPLMAGIDGSSPSRPWFGDSDFLFSPREDAVFFVANVGGSREPWTRARIWRAPIDGSAPAEDLDPKQVESATPILSPDGRFLAYLASDAFPYPRLAVRNLVRGQRRLLALDNDLYPSGIAWDGSSIIAQAEVRSDEKLFTVDPVTGRSKPITGSGSVSSFSVAKGIVAFVRSDFAHPGEVFVRARDGSVRQITNMGADRLAGIDIAETRPFSFKGWNGDTVEGWVTLPVHALEGKRYPVVLMLTGIPHQLRANAWSPRSNQIFAAAGYAVVAINTHGVTGYGRTFEEAALGHLGDRPLEDLQKGWAAALTEFPSIDGSRACVIGSGQAGYLSNWIAGAWNEPWRCIVTSGGVVDNRMAALTTDEPFPDWYFGGPVWERPTAYEVQNPITLAKAWRKPILVIHGGRDFRNTIDQGIAMFQASQARGVPSRFLYFDSEPTVPTTMHNIVQWNEVVRDWLDRWTADVEK